MPKISDKPFHCDFLKKVAQTIDDFGMIQESDSILIGVSGGPDSVALLACPAPLVIQLGLCDWRWPM